MPDQYMTTAGTIDYIEGKQDGTPMRIFKPIATYGTITVYEESHPAPATPVLAPLDFYED